jgi:DNA polymerase-3 subunit delta'
MPLKEFKDEFPAVVNAIRNAFVNAKIAHAYLLHCDDAILTDEFSKAIAQIFLCQSHEKDGDACGKCPNCISVAKGNYPELFTIVPTSKSRKIKIGKDDSEYDSIRWFQSNFYLTAAYASGKKLGIIKDADCMMPHAQNAFLKTLEEPPPNSYFIICTANPSELLPTFRSRCQRITLLRNSQKYDFDEREKMLLFLDSIASGRNDLSVAERSASGIISVFESLKEKAEAKITEKWASTIANTKGSETFAQNSLEERLEAAIQAEYLFSREKMISLIHAYFAQAYQMSSGIAKDSLPNQEVLGHCPTNDERTALDQLRKTESFLDTMKLNVQETLAIRTFCYSIVFQ